MGKRILSIVLILVVTFTSICYGNSLEVFAKKLVIKEHVSGEYFCNLKPDVLYYKIKKDKTIEIVHFRAKKIKKLVIPSKIKGKKVTSIGEGAFVSYTYEFTKLKSIVIPNSVRKIGKQAFKGCIYLKSVRLPKGLKVIKDETFSGCADLDVKIPASVTKVEREAFSVKSVTVDSKNKKYSSKDGVLFNKAKTKLIYYPYGKKQKNYVVPSGVKYIGDYAFVQAGKLTSVVLPCSVVKIGKCAFIDTCEEVTILNKNCKIEFNKKDINEEPIGPHLGFWTGFTPNICIYGYKGSTAETYVKTWKKYVKKKQYCQGDTSSLCFEEFNVDECDHQYKKTVKKATCDANGLITKKCSICGHVDKKVLYSPKEIVLSATEFTYTGQAMEPSVLIKDSQGNVIGTSNYSVDYKNNINVGQASVEITFKGNYSGTSTISFLITEAVVPQVSTQAAIK